MAYTISLLAFLIGIATSLLVENSMPRRCLLQNHQTKRSYLCTILNSQHLSMPQPSSVSRQAQRCDHSLRGRQPCSRLLWFVSVTAGSRSFTRQLATHPYFRIRIGDAQPMYASIFRSCSRNPRPETLSYRDFATSVTNSTSSSLSIHSLTPIITCKSTMSRRPGDPCGVPR